jgi:acyl-CoA synthetase (AMP-forming)/AMP-acid ligase II
VVVLVEGEVHVRPDRPAQAEELRDFCRAHIANCKIPRSVAFVDALPVSGAGQILERELRARSWEDAGQPVA